MFQLYTAALHSAPESSDLKVSYYFMVLPIDWTGHPAVGNLGNFSLQSSQGCSQMAHGPELT